MNIPNKNELTRIYGEAEKSAARFQVVADHFAEIYHHDTAEFFTAPGRTEIIGNHTDHNGGRVIALVPLIRTTAASFASQVRDMIKKLLLILRSFLMYRRLREQYLL